jgi:hypothetical protein
MAEPTRIVPDKGTRSVYNGTGGTLSKGTLVILKTTGTIKGEIIASSATSDRYYGLLTADVGDGEWGDCQVQGVALGLSGAGITKGDLVMFGTGAKVITATTGLMSAGVARETVSGADTLLEIELHGPGGQLLA